jgi:hypothetical protein
VCVCDGVYVYLFLCLCLSVCLCVCVMVVMITMMIRMQTPSTDSDLNVPQEYYDSPPASLMNAPYGGRRVVAAVDPSTILPNAMTAPGRLTRRMASTQ